MRSKKDHYKFFQIIEVQFNKKIKYIRLDNGKEFNMPKFYAKNGAIYQNSCPYTLQQNNVVETSTYPECSKGTAISSSFTSKILDRLCPSYSLSH